MKSGLDKLFVFAALALISLSTGAGAEDFKIIEVSKTTFQCQILNPSLECQMIDNQLSITIRSGAKDIESDLSIECGKTIVKAYSDLCIRDENLYTCYFVIEPAIKLGEAGALECDMAVYFYRKFSNISVGSDKYGGKLVITPVSRTSDMSLEKQKKKLTSDFKNIKSFDQEAVFNAGICSYIGTTAMAGDIERYEDEFTSLGGSIAPAQGVSVKYTNLLMNSTTLASTYAEKGDLSLPRVLESFFLNGISAGNFINQILYQLSEQYVSGRIFESLESDVGSSCDVIANDFGQLINPNFMTMKKIMLMDCLEKRDFKNCWKKLEGMRDYINPSGISDKSELRLYVNGRLFTDGSNACGSQQLKIQHKSLERFGVDYITVNGPDTQKICENNISVDRDGMETYSLAEFICGKGKPPDGRYSIIINPGVFGEKVTYRLNYYENPDKCKAKEDVVPA